MKAPGFPYGKYCFQIIATNCASYINMTLLFKLVHLAWPRHPLVQRKGSKPPFPYPPPLFDPQMPGVRFDCLFLFLPQTQLLITHPFPSLFVPFVPMP